MTLQGEHCSWTDVSSLITWRSSVTWYRSCELSYLFGLISISNLQQESWKWEKKRLIITVVVHWTPRRWSRRQRTTGRSGDPPCACGRPPRYQQWKLSCSSQPWRAQWQLRSVRLLWSADSQHSLTQYNVEHLHYDVWQIEAALVNKIIWINFIVNNID